MSKFTKKEKGFFRIGQQTGANINEYDSTKKKPSKSGGFYTSRSQVAAEIGGCPDHGREEGAEVEVGGLSLVYSGSRMLGTVLHA